MQTVLIVIHIMTIIALVATVLLQRSEGGAFLGTGGGGFMTGRGQANVLTRATAILAAVFFATSLALTIVANVTRAPRSILEGVPPPATSTPAVPTPQGSLMDQLQKLQQQRQQQQTPESGAPAAPQAPRSQ
ncbi:MAG: preprotein translocase subunit SecG [Methylovirgula sp.]|jgi:preprotein translocase subunit SecG